MDIDVDVDVVLPVNFVPLIDDTDFITRETAIVYNQAGMDLVWNFLTTAGVFTQTGITPTTSGDYDWINKGDGMYGIEVPASGGASINNDAEGMGWFSGICTGVLAWVSPRYTFKPSAVNNALINGGDVLDVSVIEIGGNTQSATDLKDFADSGYDPATHKVQGVVLIDTATTLTNKTGFSLAATGLDAIVQSATGMVEIAKAVWNRELTGVTHNVPTSAGRRLRGLGGVTAFAVNDVTPTATSFISTLTSSIDDFYIDTVVHGTSGDNLDATRIISAYNGTTKEVTFDEAWPVTPSDTDTFDLRPEHVHSVSSIIIATLNTVVDNTYNIAKSWGKRLRGIEEYQGYEGGFIYIDTVNGSAGGDPYVNGTLDNPVDNMTDLNSLAAALGISSFKVISGSSITLTASQEKQIFSGEIFTLALGSQNINGTTFHGASVSGIATGGSVKPKFEDCNIGDVTLPPCHLDKCGLGGTIIAGSSGDYFLADNCHSAVAGTGAPVIDFGAAVGDVGINLRWYSGGMELKNMGQTGIDAASIEGNGQVIINANSIGGAVAIRGHQTITGGAAFIAAGGIITDDARFATDQFAPLTALVEDIDTSAESAAKFATTDALVNAIDTSAESAARFTEIKGAGWTDETLRAIKLTLDEVAPNGIRQVTLQYYITGGSTPIPGIEVSIYNSDLSAFLERKTTDANGQIIMGRDDGTFKLIAKKAEYAFTVPETIVVTQNETFTKYGDSFTIPLPGDPDACNLYIDLVDLGLSKEAGVEFTANLVPIRAKSGTVILNAQPYKDTTDVNGRIIMPLAKGFEFDISSRALGKYDQTLRIDTTGKDTLNLADEI